MPICTKCTEEKSEDFFYKRRDRSGQIMTVCAACTCARTKANVANRYREDPDKQREMWKNARANYMRKYARENKLRTKGQNLKRYWPELTGKQSLERYNAMFAAQNGCCKICSRHQIELTVSLCVDHQEDPWKIRGLLCDSCNRAIGLLKHDVQIINSAAEYILETT